MSCHMPDKVKESGAREISKNHFQSWRPQLDVKAGVYSNPKEDKQVYVKEVKDLNMAYFNCSQCHVPQADVTIDIENLFTAEFREKFGIEESNLKDKVNEGVNN